MKSIRNVKPVKKPFVIRYQKVLIFLRIIVPFHRVTFDHSISCVLLIDTPNESCQNSKKSFVNNATYHPMNPDADVTYQTVNLFSSDKYFICFISDCPHYIQRANLSLPELYSVVLI